jgi:hypothetical protein
MVDSVSTFRAVCRGGLNTGADVLSTGEDSPGSATQLLNYEPNLEGGYRRLTGFANNFGTVPGTGSVLGVQVASGINQGILACRTPSSGNNYLHHWSFYYTVAVTSGQGSSFTVGETVSAVTSSSDSSSTGITGTVIAKASASLTINFGTITVAAESTSIFATNNVITGASSSASTTVTSTPTVVGWTAVSTSGSPTMTGVSKVRFTEINFGVPKVVLTDGINPAATYDGSTYTQITDSNAPTDPLISAEFQNHLFLAGDPAQPSNLFFSAPTAETDFSPANGGGVINVGFSIVAIRKFRNVLFIFGQNNIKRLVGDNSANFVLESVTSNLGCLSTDSVIELGGDLLFLAPDGIRPIGGTNKIGDVNLETVSKPIQSQIKNTILSEDLSKLSSVLIRSKSQFRYLFDTPSSQGILGALRETRGNISFEFAQTFGIECTCADSGYIGVNPLKEFVIHGARNGKVFEQESGNAFDTSNILSIFKTPFIYMGNPEQRKTFYSTSTYMSAEGNFSVALSVTYDYDNTDIATPDNLTLSTTSPGAFFDRGTNIAVFDTTDIFDGNPSPVESATFSGSGKAIALTFVTDDTNESHSIQGFTITHGLGDVR